MGVGSECWRKDEAENNNIRLRLLKMNFSSSSASPSEEEMISPAEMRGESVQEGQQQQCCGDDSDNLHHNHRGLYLRRRQQGNLSGYSSFSSSSVTAILVTFLVVAAVTIGESPVSAYGDPVYIRKVNGYLQLLSSDTLRWFKQGTAKEPLKLMRPTLEPAVICRVWHTSLRGVGLVSEDQNVCNISTQEGAQGSDKYQTLSTSASRLVWKMWQRPNPPPIGAVAISFKPAKFLAADVNSSVIGYLDPSKNLGSGVFPNEQEPATSCLVLTEIEPERYELSDVQLKRNKGFIEEDIVLAYGRLKYEIPAQSGGSGSIINNSPDWSREGEEDAVQLKPESNELGGFLVGDMGKKGKVESILSYETNTLDSWGQGYLMAKGLHTSIKLEDGNVKTIEWGIPSTQSGKTETMTAVAELAPGTGVNVTLRGTRIDGEMSYWATLKTIFKDGSSSTRLLEGHRRIKDIQDIRLEHSRIYFLYNDSVVPDPTTTTTTTTTTTPLPISEEEEEDGGGGGEDEDGVNALPVESRNEFLADQGHTGGDGGGFMSSSSSSQHHHTEKSNSPAASVAYGGARTSSLSLYSSLTALSAAVVLLRTLHDKMLML